MFCMLAPRAPHAEHGGLFVHLKKSFLNQLKGVGNGRTNGTPTGKRKRKRVHGLQDLPFRGRARIE